MTHPALNNILENNRQWQKNKSAIDSEFFSQSAKGQSPTFLWLGCVDSRVPAEIVCGVDAGEMLTHRNIANQFLSHDTSANAIVEFAIGVLKIPNIIVCGHTSCGGIKAGIAESANDGHAQTRLQEWVTPLAELYKTHQKSLKNLDEAEQANQLAQLSVIAQVEKLAQHKTVLAAQSDGQSVTIHGLMFDVATGALSDLGTSRGND